MPIFAGGEKLAKHIVLCVAPCDVLDRGKGHILFEAKRADEGVGGMVPPIMRGEDGVVQGAFGATVQVVDMAGSFLESAFHAVQVTGLLCLFEEFPSLLLQGLDLLDDDAKFLGRHAA